MNPFGDDDDEAVLRSGMAVVPPNPFDDDDGHQPTVGRTGTGTGGGARRHAAWRCPSSSGDSGNPFDEDDDGVILSLTPGGASGRADRHSGASCVDPVHRERHHHRSRSAGVSPGTDPITCKVGTMVGVTHGSDAGDGDGHRLVASAVSSAGSGSSPSSPIIASLDAFRSFSSSPQFASLSTATLCSSPLATEADGERPQRLELPSVAAIDASLGASVPSPMPKMADQESLDVHFQQSKVTTTDQESLGVRSDQRTVYHLPATSWVCPRMSSGNELDEKADAQVRAIIEYREFNLQTFRSLVEKRALLDSAVASMNGNAVMTVILFLKDTLNSTNFLSLISTQRTAANMYIRYLRLRGRHLDAVLVHHARRDRKQEGLTRLALCYRHCDAEKRLSAFRDCLQFFQVLNPKLFEFESKQLAYQINLLQIQIQMEHVDASRVANAEPIFVSFPRSSILHSGFGATLYYSLFYHSYRVSGKARGIAFLPENMRKAFHVNEKRYYWLKLRALCCKQQWTAVRELPCSSGLFSSRPTSPIGFVPFVDTIHHFKGPVSLLREFLLLIRSPMKRYRTAFRIAQYDIAIDALVTTKDEKELRWLLKEISAEVSSEHRAKLERALASLQSTHTDQRRGSP